MAKVVWTGIESSGKSLQLSIMAKKVMLRNRRWYKVTGVRRSMCFNSPMSPEFIEQINECSIYVQYKNFDEIAHLEECDIFVDEIIKFFPAKGSDPLNNEQIHFLTQGSKSGINVYGASQDFSQVHKQFRLLVNEVYVVTKLIGSRRPMKTSPPVKRIWGVCIKRQVRTSSFRGDSATMETVGFPVPFMILKEDCDRFDTSFKIPMSTLPVKKLRLQMEVCDEDGFTRKRYV